MALRSLAGGKLFAEAIGDGRPRVLALHGWGRRGSDFTHSLVSFGALAVDLPGFGATAAPSEVLGSREYAGLLTPVFDQFDAPPVVVGHSFGGRVAVCLAAQRPDLVGPVLVTGAPLLRINKSVRPAAMYRLARKLNQLGLVSDSRMEELKRQRGSQDYRAATGIMRDILVKAVNEEYTAELEKLSQLSLLWGADDTEVPPAVAEAAARIITSHGGSATLEVIEGVGHLLPLQAPQALASAVESLLVP